LRGIGPSHNLKGVSWIADFYILVGIIWIIMNLMILFSSTFSGILLIGYGILIVGYGIFLVIAGFYLDGLNRWAFIIVVIENLVSTIVFIISLILNVLSTEHINITSIIFNIVSIAVCIIIVVYLLTPRVRSHFRIGNEDRVSVLDCIQS
jgi:hypothetical protein